MNFPQTEAHKQLSPGTVLTAYMMEQVIDKDRVSRIDFLSGDDEYKLRRAASTFGWMKQFKVNNIGYYQRSETKLVEYVLKKTGRYDDPFSAVQTRPHYPN